jgi:hypothetical protein
MWVYAKSRGDLRTFVGTPPLISMRSMSPSFHFARSSACRTAGIVCAPLYDRRGQKVLLEDMERIRY